ncbi:MAG TPA: glutamate-1-semialdehyde 2,1-aminomutase [Acidobacteriota bacterium]|nr:glutamate-1-semialdehyde 2,1-aminomutase [Acidobacteriota bacterium]HMZ78583.1 glutamate-1-semialdehyde 2,1-aminomutase [Acidobacteriota bacterium]HNB70839.1 glutamate-1-semialdehyde 2,1-aminomutase [Acidobacteriota bacterium]HND17886.1 glutamate-1-semialdehyde 2,1-aminomutase [Acidobacteriota bacterium]HNG91411.1 glutamate-1-semialdehyde 2,1-aminomutase [Acidobacteriota bacterium]
MAQIDTSRSEKLFQRAQAVIPGGVNSPVRAFRGVGGTPLFIRSAQGPYLTDVDGRRFVDYIGSWGPMILGHGHPEVLEALRKALERGTSYGAPTEIEVEMAELICSMVPSLEKVRMVSSGTEATMSAIRLARGYTGRNKLVKFIGCYHGHGDPLLVKAGSGVATLGLPDSLGVPPETAQHTIAVPFNNLEALRQVFETWSNDIACVIVEPVVGNMGCVAPQPGYLEGMRELTQTYGAVLIFDEVMTGFRLAHGGAQERYGVKPDLTTLGKIMGGGLPAAAYGGKREIMDYVAPLGPVYQAGTLSGNPLAMTAGLTTLKLLQQPGVYDNLERLSNKLVQGLRHAADKAGFKTVINSVGSMFTLFFTSTPVTDWETAKTSDTQLFAKFFHAMLAEGVYFPPSQFEAAFFGLAHTNEIIDSTIAASERAFGKMKN